MNIIVADSYEEMSEKAGHILVAQLLQKPESVLGLATGDTPLGLYRVLVKLHQQNRVSFASTTVFNLDEYIGVSKAHKQSYARYMQENLFDYLDINRNRCHIPNGDADDTERECLRYDLLLDEAKGIDLQILGIGRNGHIGFNEPGRCFKRSTHVVHLNEDTIRDNARFFKRIADVPKRAISMGIRTIMEAKQVMVLASGPDKAKAVKKMISGPITPMVPASILQLHANALVILDRAAASEILNEENKEEDEHNGGSDCQKCTWFTCQASYTGGKSCSGIQRRNLSVG